MSYSEFTHQSVLQQHQAELRRELGEIRAARGLPSDEGHRPVRQAIERVSRSVANAVRRALRHQAGSTAQLSR